MTRYKTIAGISLSANTLRAMLYIFTNGLCNTRIVNVARMEAVIVYTSFILLAVIIDCALYCAVLKKTHTGEGSHKKKEKFYV